MEKVTDEIVVLLNQISEGLNKRLETIENRLARLEKVDAIEHRVTSNQIDITDIKELLQKQEENQNEKLINVLKDVFENFEKPVNEQLAEMNRRLDAQLIKIAKTEEEIYLIKNPRKF